MISRQPMQDITNQDYQIPWFSSPSTGIEDTNVQYFSNTSTDVKDDIDSWNRILHNLMRRRLKTPPSRSWLSLSETDFSSIWPSLKIRSETFQVEESTRGQIMETISEEDIAVEMIEHDFVVQMPPKKRYKLQVIVRSIRKGEPRIAEADEFWVGEEGGML